MLSLRTIIIFTQSIDNHSEGTKYFVTINIYYTGNAQPKYYAQVKTWLKKFKMYFKIHFLL